MSNPVELGGSLSVKEVLKYSNRFSSGYEWGPEVIFSEGIR